MDSCLRDIAEHPLPENIESLYIGGCVFFFIQTFNLNLQATPFFDMRPRLLQSARPLIRPPSSLFTGSHPPWPRGCGHACILFFARGNHD
jgi:hypothetical protein